MEELWASLSQQPADTEMRQRLANLYQQNGFISNAHDQFYHLFALDPSNAGYCVSVGITMQTKGDIRTAMCWYRHAIQLNPSYAIPYSNIANCLLLLHLPKQAEWYYRRATALDPRFVDAHSNLGNLLRETSRPKRAIKSYKRALDIDPTHVNTWTNLGSIYEEQGRWLDAIGSFKQALSLVPYFPLALANLVHCFTIICDWTKRDQLVYNLITMTITEMKSLGYSSIVQPHHALSYPLRPDDITSIAYAFSKWVHHNAMQLCTTQQRSPPHHIPENYWKPDTERLRIGYISSDFGNHPLSQLMQHCFAMHDRQAFEVFGYALSANDGTKAREIIQAGIEHFFDVHQKLSLEIYDLIMSHHLHILIDLNGYTRGARPEILALRPATIQVHYMGFAGTMDQHWAYICLSAQCCKWCVIY